ncbi:MAG: hypothetical protein P4L99_25975 [Chthoniobacter sp.]|nr:hypothetical protein [Chthoniobacter sp.]
MKHTLLLLSVFFATSVPLCAQVDTGRPTSGTPYDRFLGSVRQILGRSGGAPTVDEVRSQLRTARRFRYYYNPAEPYVPQAPEVTEAQRQGDCKAKALWLASKMGGRNVRYVIGKMQPSSRISHAWLLWLNGGTWLHLDPTNESDLLNADRIVGRKLIPQYSYTSSSTYSHPTYNELIKK